MTAARALAVLGRHQSAGVDGRESRMRRESEVEGEVRVKRGQRGESSDRIIRGRVEPWWSGESESERILYMLSIRSTNARRREDARIRTLCPDVVRRRGCNQHQTSLAPMGTGTYSDIQD